MQRSAVGRVQRSGRACQECWDHGVGKLSGPQMGRQEHVIILQGSSLPASAQQHAEVACIAAARVKRRKERISAICACCSASVKQGKLLVWLCYLTTCA